MTFILSFIFTVIIVSVAVVTITIAGRTTTIFEWFMNKMKKVFTTATKTRIHMSTQPGEKLEFMKATCEACKKELYYLKNEDVAFKDIVIDDTHKWICDDCYAQIKEICDTAKKSNITLSPEMRKLADIIGKKETKKS